MHIIDREGDSISHMRELSSHEYSFLIRGKGGHTVEYQGKNQKLNDVADSLSYNNTVTINYKGKKSYLSVSEATITLTRMAKPKRFNDEGKRISLQPGKPLPLRLVVSKVSDKKGNVLARWVLLSNVPKEIKCDELARWYYWRSTIESFFKLIKSAGHNVESWLQKSAKALLRRLIIASMACVLVWRIQRDEGIQNAKTRKFLCRLSGRLQKEVAEKARPLF
uniref:Transposase IS4-like domain-containing protein n=1 Tax=Arsenophonus endosymbiont of Trialeurodes vaporariorum TaxID=235567 RepID=A0A3B0M3N6_9GAMM